MRSGQSGARPLPVDQQLVLARDAVRPAAELGEQRLQRADPGRVVRGDLARQRDRRGLGLGLYIARCLVEAQGGRISARSAPGRGSTFSFTLPLAPRAA